MTYEALLVFSSPINGLCLQVSQQWMVSQKSADMASQYSFDWSHTKARRNLAKHGVSFRQAMSVFRDPLALTLYDDEHSDDEERWITLGMASNSACLVVVHTALQAGPAQLHIRIISARKADHDEEQIYWQAPR